MIIEILGDKPDFIENISFDSRNIANGDLFVAVSGNLYDGHEYISSAIEKGARIIVCEKMPARTENHICYIKVADSHESLGILAANMFGNPSGSLKLVGVTGTNGKTTVASLLFEITRILGYSSGLISTIKVSVNGKEKIATHTTPDPVQIQSVLKEMVEEGCEFAFMEVSSHAIHQKRISGLEFSGGIFTNLTHDHLDYHKDFSDYRDTKKMFFDQLGAGSFALSNKDDKNGMLMLQNTRAKKYSYSLKSDSEFKARILEMHLEGNHLEINGQEVWSMLPGRFNAYNIMAVYGGAILLGLKKEEVLKALSKLKSVEGRFEILKGKKGATAIVDYAHTPDALENVLKTIREIRHTDKIIAIVGAGGNRDKTKRPLMAKIAAELSNKLILTSDNPRSEDPAEIIEDMRKGVDGELSAKVISITNREEAIRTACSFAEENDIILVAGKGHETYQEIKGVKYHFDDREKVKEFLNI